MINLFCEDIYKILVHFIYKITAPIIYHYSYTLNGNLQFNNILK